MCGWHVHMQITCEQCPDVTYRENHQHRLCCKSFTWSRNETTQHCCDKFHSITSSCQSRKIVQVHADPWRVLQMMCGWHMCLQMICGWHTCLRMMCGWCTHLQMMCRQHSGLHMSSASWNLQWSLILVSSAHHPHIVHASSAHHLPRDFNPKIFPVKEQRTALLKTNKEKILAKTAWVQRVSCGAIQPFKCPFKNHIPGCTCCFSSI